MTLYTYQGCSTCKAAVKWLRARGIAFTEKPVRETPPTVQELRAMLAALGGDERRLFNTSGQDYRQMGLKDRLPGMETDEKLDLLTRYGSLVKRPFLIDEAAGVFLTGFKEPEWSRALGPGQK